MMFHNNIVKLSEKLNNDFLKDVEITVREMRTRLGISVITVLPHPLSEKGSNFKRKEFAPPSPLPTLGMKLFSF